MKTLVGAIVVALALVSNAQAEEKGKVDSESLAAMGLSELQTMTDEEGQQVRGTAAYAFGGGFAFFSSPFGSSGQVGGYGAFGYPSFAAGGNYVQAGSLFPPIGVYAFGASAAGGF